MILGNGLRLGASYMAVSVASAALGFAVTGINGGSIGITGDATQIYAVGSEDKTVSSNSELDPYRAVIVGGNLALNLPGVDDTADKSPQAQAYYWRH